MRQKYLYAIYTNSMYGEKRLRLFRRLKDAKEALNLVYSKKYLNCKIRKIKI